MSSTFPVYLSMSSATVDSNNQSVAAPMLVLAGGFVLMMAGALYAASAEPYRWDAINIFNDSADPQLQPQAPPRWAPAPTETMRMRPAE